MHIHTLCEHIYILNMYIITHGHMLLTKHEERTFHATKNGICNCNPEYIAKGIKMCIVLFQRKTFFNVTCCSCVC